MTKMLSTKAFEQWLKAQAEIIKRYRQVEKSSELATYNELKGTVDSLEFQANKGAFRRTLLGKLRWLSTPMHQQEKQLQSLAKNADIILYLTHTAEQIQELESYKTVWAEEFEKGKLSDSWQTGFLYASPTLKKDHSHVSEQQAYTQGKNTQVANNTLHILTKKEKVTAAAWHPTKGMIMHNFAYTSDVWHTAEAVAPTAGVLQAKVRYTGKAKHVLCLTNSNAQKALPILPANKIEKNAIYTIVWNEKEVINYVNNVEVARTKNPLSGEALHLLVRSYLPENQKAGAGQLDIDWVRIYAK
jgi:hypothetical protein